MTEPQTIPIRQQAARNAGPAPGFAGARHLAGAGDPAVSGVASAVVDDQIVPPVMPASMDPLDVRALLHPAEHSRLLIALSSSAVAFGGAAMFVYAMQGWTVLVLYAGYVAVFGGLVWLLLQVARSRLLGGAVRVSEATLPELQSVVDRVRVRLDYRKDVDVYVMDTVPGGSAMTSYLGTRLIQIEGGLAAELLDKDRHAELMYLIGRHLGQLKARHQRLQPIVLVISLIDSLKFLQLFLAPYVRATVKSGDQIAAACCGDIRAAADMMNRLLAGKELGPRLVIGGVLDQAATVRRRWLPRLAQLFMGTPHVTNRYLNLLAFFARVAPNDISQWRASLDDGAASRLAAMLDASPKRRPPRRRASPLSMLVAVLVSGALLAFSGWVIFGSPVAAAFKHRPVAPSTRASRQLLARVPRALAATCVPIPVPVADASQGANAEVVCQPRAIGRPGAIIYVHYREPAAMQRAYAVLSRRVPSGNCTAAAGQGSYWLGSSSRPAGDLACVVTRLHQTVFFWTDNRLDILSSAASASMTIPELYHWWHSDAGPGPTRPGGRTTLPPPLSRIAATLSAYFGAINARNYRLAWSQLSPGNQAVNPYPLFAAGDSTTTIAGWKLHGIVSGSRPGTFVAFVTFQSHQNPTEAPNHSDSCDNWSLNYTMIQSSGLWVISQANPHPGVPEYQRC